jgi:hypothetical protein
LGSYINVRRSRYQNKGISLKVGTKAKSIESTLGMWLEKGLKTKMVQTHNLADEEIVELVLAKLTKAPVSKKPAAGSGGAGKAVAATTTGPDVAGGVGGGKALSGGSSSRLAASSSRAADRAAAKQAGAAKSGGGSGAPSKAAADKLAK